MIEVVVCQTGLRRHDPELEPKLVAAGARMQTVECFDRCETCERFLIARIDGATTRFSRSHELVAAIHALGEP